MQGNPAAIRQPIEVRSILRLWNSLINEKGIPIDISAFLPFGENRMTVFMNARSRHVAGSEDFEDGLEPSDVIRVAMRQYDIGYRCYWVRTCIACLKVYQGPKAFPQYR